MHNTSLKDVTYKISKTELNVAITTVIIQYFWLKLPYLISSDQKVWQTFKGGFGCQTMSLTIKFETVGGASE